jgi:hypothetical protein
MFRVNLPCQHLAVFFHSAARFFRCNFQCRIRIHFDSAAAAVVDDVDDDDDVDFGAALAVTGVLCTLLAWTSRNKQSILLSTQQQAVSLPLYVHL